MAVGNDDKSSLVSSRGRHEVMQPVLEGLWMIYCSGRHPLCPSRCAPLLLSFSLGGFTVAANAASAAAADAEAIEFPYLTTVGGMVTAQATGQ